MYQNVGKNIKQLVSSLVKLMIVLAIITGVIIVIASIVAESFFGVFIGIVVAVLGSYLSWVSGLILYAYGEITDCVQKMACSVQKEIINDINDRPEQTATEAEVDPWANGSWVCRSCGTENPIKRKYCLQCNSSKEWSDSKND